MVFQNGLLKCKVKQLKMKHVILKSFNFRAANGTAAGAIYLEWKAMHPQMYHYSKEVIYSIQTTYITPKGSPLQVDIKV